MAADPTKMTDFHVEWAEVDAAPKFAHLGMMVSEACFSHGFVWVLEKQFSLAFVASDGQGNFSTMLFVPFEDMLSTKFRRAQRTMTFIVPFQRGAEWLGENEQQVLVSQEQTIGVTVELSADDVERFAEAARAVWGKFRSCSAASMRISVAQDPIYSTSRAPVGSKSVSSAPVREADAPADDDRSVMTPVPECRPTSGNRAHTPPFAHAGGLGAGIATGGTLTSGEPATSRKAAAPLAKHLRCRSGSPPRKRKNTQGGSSRKAERPTPTRATAVASTDEGPTIGQLLRGVVPRLPEARQEGSLCTKPVTAPVAAAATAAVAEDTRAAQETCEGEKYDFSNLDFIDGQEKCKGPKGTASKPADQHQVAKPKQQRSTEARKAAKSGLSSSTKKPQRQEPANPHALAEVVVAPELAPAPPPPPTKVTARDHTPITTAHVARLRMALSAVPTTRASMAPTSPLSHGRRSVTELPHHLVADARDEGTLEQEEIRLMLSRGLGVDDLGDFIAKSLRLVEKKREAHRRLAQEAAAAAAMCEKVVRSCSDSAAERRGALMTASHSQLGECLRRVQTMQENVEDLQNSFSKASGMLLLATSSVRSEVETLLESLANGMRHLDERERDDTESAMRLVREHFTVKALD